MATRNINEFLASNEAGDIRNNGNINSVGNIDAVSITTDSTVRYNGVTPDNDGMFLRIDANGNTYAFRVENQDTEWIDSRTDVVTIDSTERVIAGVTVDQDIQKEVGSWSFAAKIDAETRFDTALTLTMKVDGVITRTKTIKIQGDETGYPVATWDDFAGDVASNASCVVTATADRELTLRGDLTPTTLKVVHQNSAPVTKVIQVNADLGNGISRGEIENAVGVSVSTLKDTQKYVIADNANHAWFVVWLKSLDKFAATKLNLK